mgnify:CR=1 FL=1
MWEKGVNNYLKLEMFRFEILIFRLENLNFRSQKQKKQL